MGRLNLALSCVAIVTLSFVLLNDHAARIMRPHVWFGFVLLVLVWSVATLDGSNDLNRWDVSLLGMLYLVFLPFWNAVCDFISVCASAILLKRARTVRIRYLPIVWLADLAVALASSVLLVVGSVFFIALINNVGIRWSGSIFVDVRALIKYVQIDPLNPALWWLYLTIFSTFLPSFMHGVTTVTSALNAALPNRLNAWLSQSLKEEFQTDIDRRVLVAGFLTFRQVLSFLLTGVSAVLLVAFVWLIAPWIAEILLTASEWAAAEFDLAYQLATFAA